MQKKINVKFGMEQVYDMKKFGNGGRKVNDTAFRYQQPSRTIVHAKLEMTEPGDHEEQEADAVANDIVNGGKIRRKISNGGGSGIAVSPQVENQIAQLQGGGHAMPEGLRNMMENGFGRDFSQVRLHTDSQAADMSSSISARAFTHGNDIYFNRGQFSPNTTEGQRLVAHELTHVVQSTGRVARSPKNDNQEVGQTEIMNDAIENYLKPEKFIVDGIPLHNLLKKLEDNNLIFLFEQFPNKMSVYFREAPDGFMNMYCAKRRAIINFRIRNQEAFLAIIFGIDEEGIGYLNYQKYMTRFGFENDGIYGDPDQIEEALTNAKTVAKDCKKSIDRLIDSINDQDKINKDQYIISTIAEILGGEAGTSIADFIAVLNTMKSEIEDVEHERVAAKIWNVVRRIAPLIDIISVRYHSYRNNVIEGAEDGLAAAYITKTVAFATLATLMSGGTVVGSILAGAAVAGIDNTVSQLASDNGPYNGGKTDQAKVIGGIQGGLGTVPAELSKKVGMDAISKVLSSNPAGVVMGVAISLATDELMGSSPEIIRPLLLESGEHEGDALRGYLIALYYAPHIGLEYDQRQKSFIVVKEMEGDDADRQSRMRKILNSYLEDNPNAAPKK